MGLDIVEIDRARSILARFGKQALRRFLTESEREYVTSREDPAPYFAVRVAAKEAAYKALQSLPGMRGVGWQDLEVTRRSDGRPELRLSGQAAALPSRYTLLLSLTHTHVAAAAVVVLTDRPTG